ncbi:hypothetical protein ADIS_3148 [Lunatimonas lonarensis]|uniref:Uncharacterized protein n=1 Tax=Lunatimonas lonarensis TaxID=1232681 RepID=R7ZRM2_9BACT|nr:hypothetical protein ADIS_3148 [Lunatimonas lonarensis]
MTQATHTGMTIRHATCLFDHTILERADFRTSYNFSIDPEKN